MNSLQKNRLLNLFSVFQKAACGWKVNLYKTPDKYVLHCKAIHISKNHGAFLMNTTFVPDA